MALTSCSDCQGLVDASACRCPHCQASLRVCRPRSLAAAALALGLLGCPKKDSTDTDTDAVFDTGLVAPLYGVPASADSP